MFAGAERPTFWMVLAVVALILFGYKKLPDAARSVGRSLRIFKTEMKGMNADDAARADAASTATADSDATGAATGTGAAAPTAATKAESSDEPADRAPARSAD